MQAVNPAAAVELELEPLPAGALLVLLLLLHAVATAIASTLSAATVLSDPLTVPPLRGAACRRCGAPTLMNPGPAG
jgi:hypothetical protein